MKYFGIVSYLGEGYFGFQRQKNKKTIQGQLEKSLSHVLGTPTEIKAAGRTDAGVNARGQTFSFSGREVESVEALRRSLNRVLPEEILIKSLAAVPMDFDARHSSVAKTYSYRFSFGERDPFLKGRVAQLQRPSFDWKAFETALRSFEGKHNFQNFTSKSEDIDNFVRTISSIEIIKNADGVSGTVIFQGNGFMTYQIRFMMGTALKCAYNQLNPGDVIKLLDATPRHIVSYKAPAEGLYLDKVDYGADL